MIIQEASYAADQRQVEINLALSDVHEFPNLETDTFKLYCSQTVTGVKFLVVCDLKQGWAIDGRECNLEH